MHDEIKDKLLSLLGGGEGIATALFQQWEATTDDRAKAQLLSLIISLLDWD